eukprot:GHRQ01031673.1.p1 GENE.GHRQ01031673.1~~GHRQ01031673.1.p1  ORF type:complete len:101 (-),score=9.72 GHRQ01031673.1:180-482(-)
MTAQEEGRGTGAKLRKFQADDDLQLFAVSPADAAAEAVSNRDNQVYFGKGAISLREGEQFNPAPNHLQAVQVSLLARQQGSGAQQSEQHAWQGRAPIITQ